MQTKKSSGVDMVELVRCGGHTDTDKAGGYNRQPGHSQEQPATEYYNIGQTWCLPSLCTPNTYNVYLISTSKNT